MDSRSKIGLAKPPGATVVRGCFDPLLAVHARELASLPRPLAVLLVEPSDGRPFLPMEARQLLIAALACVDCVLASGTTNPAIDVDWTEAHEKIRRDFIEHVQARSSAG